MPDPCVVNGLTDSEAHKYCFYHTALSCNPYDPHFFTTRRSICDECPATLPGLCNFAIPLVESVIIANIDNAGNLNDGTLLPLGDIWHNEAGWNLVCYDGDPCGPFENGTGLSCVDVGAYSQEDCSGEISFTATLHDPEFDYIITGAIIIPSLTTISDNTIANGFTPQQLRTMNNGLRINIDVDDLAAPSQKAASEQLKKFIVQAAKKGAHVPKPPPSTMTLLLQSILSLVKVPFQVLFFAPSMIVRPDGTNSADIVNDIIYPTDNDLSVIPFIIFSGNKTALGFMNVRNSALE